MNFDSQHRADSGAQEPTLIKNIVDKLESVSTMAKMAFISPPKDIVDAIKQDHKSLRNFLATLKNLDGDIERRREAFSLFSELLKSHTVAEEQIVYVRLKSIEDASLKMRVAAGFVEHQVADDLMRRADQIDDEFNWSAYANVLSENVEHHLAEEERDLLPKIDQHIPDNMRTDMLNEFVRLRESSQKNVSEDNAGVLESIVETQS